MYILTVVSGETALRPRGPVTARQALLDWHEEEATGYRVTCRDDDGQAVTKVQLREAVRTAHRA